MMNIKDWLYLSPQQSILQLTAAELPQQSIPAKDWGVLGLDYNG